MSKFLRYILMLFLISTLTGCFHWIRAYRTYLQMDEFDKNFAITVVDEFSVHFKEPILYSDDFIALAKLHPSRSIPDDNGKRWRYWFRKVDEQGNVIHPEIKFYIDLSFNAENRLRKWSFSPLFLQIAPAEFLEVSIRSVGGAKINKGKRQLKANTELIEKISSKLPLKGAVVSQLGTPLTIDDEETKEIYHYHFRLETPDIKKGYEDRALSAIKLSFDKQTEELIKMSGRFAGLKISINYKKYLKQEQGHLAQAGV